MAYIRIKKIGTNKYAYVVESVTTPKGSRQKVREYLGRVYEFDGAFETDSSTISTKDAKKYILELLTPYLKKIGFKHTQEGYTSKNLCLSNSLVLSKGKSAKPIALKINGGYVSTFTLHRLLSFKKSKDVRKDGAKLATYFHQAGIPISQEQFVAFYQIL